MISIQESNKIVYFSEDLMSIRRYLPTSKLYTALAKLRSVIGKAIFTWLNIKSGIFIITNATTYDSLLCRSLFGELSYVMLRKCATKISSLRVFVYLLETNSISSSSLCTYVANK